MTVDILRGAGTAEQVGQAERAVKAFRKLQPTLTSYARVLTGKKNVRVDMAAMDNGSTDGTRIYFRPPIALGDPTPHDRHKCDKRDEDGRMTCPACAIREKVLVTIMHEIAHIAFDSFQKTTDRDKVRAIEFAIKESKGKYADHIKARIDDAPEYVTSSFMGLANLINEYLPFLINCLEDARVNHEMFKVRPGLKRMFIVDTIEVFEKGFENRDTDGILRTKLWREAPLNSQAMIGVFCKASGYEYSDWFHPKVVEALDDAELTGLVNRMDGIESAGAVYNLAFQVLARLRELGFCGTPQDPDPEPEEESEDDSEDQDNNSSDEAEESSGGGSGPSPGAGNDSNSASEVPESREDQGADSSASPPEQGEGEADSDPSGKDSTEESAGSDDESSSQEGSEEVDEQEGTGDGSDSQEPEPDSDSSSDNAAQDGNADGTDTDRDAEDKEASKGSADAESEFDSDGTGSAGQTSGEDELDEGDNNETGGQAGEGDYDSDASSSGKDSSSPQEGSPSLGAPSNGEKPSPETEPDSTSEDSNSSASSESSEDDSDSTDGSDQSEDEVIDSGADDGYGGTTLLGEDESTPEMGSPDEVDPVIKQWGQHDEKPKSVAERQEETAVDRAIVQGIYFTRPSKNVFGVKERRFNESQDHASAWRRYKFGQKVGQIADIEVPESILQPAILKMRRAFTDNQIGALDTNRRSGRINRRVLGRRAWNEDDRLFSKKTQPGKKDYEVIIGMDISGSTIGRNLALEKRAIMAQATMLDRVGVPFSIVAHTGDYHDGTRTHMGLDLQIYHIKDHGEPWNDKTIERLQAIGHSAANLDGHALEYLRKRADESRAVEKIILYYSDGKMPAENHDEELEILTSEIALCRQKGYTLLGIGIRTDSPSRHGLDTVEVHEDSDLVKVVQHLARRLSGTVRR